VLATSWVANILKKRGPGIRSSWNDNDVKKRGFSSSGAGTAGPRVGSVGQDRAREVAGADAYLMVAVAGDEEAGARRHAHVRDDAAAVAQQERGGVRVLRIRRLAVRLTRHVEWTGTLCPRLVTKCRLTDK